MTKYLARPRCAEDGFTLIEMIIAVLISTMIIAVMAAVFVTSARSTNSTAHRSNQANDAQVISSFLVRDAQAAGGVNPQTGLNDTDQGAFTNSPIAACTSGGSVISGTVLRFRWVDRTNAPTYYDAIYWLSGNRFVRTLCTTPTAGGSTTSTDATLAKTVQSAATTCTTHTATGVCNNGSNGQPQMPDSVHLLITATTNSNPANGAVVGAYTYTLTASLRPARLAAADNPNPDNSAPAALITLGGSCSPPAINLDNNTSLKIYGDVLLNQDVSCITRGHGTELLYRTLNGSGVSNPFTGLQPPSTAGLPSQSGCPGGVAQPGYYPSGLTVNGSCTLQSGVYIFQTGLSLSNNASLSNAAGGVLMYIPTGVFHQSNNSSVDVQGISTGPYAGLSLWQVSGTAIDFGNNSSITMAGTWYSPLALVHFSNNATATQITTVIAASVDFKNNSGASFGPAPRALAISAVILPAWTLGAAFTPVQVTGSGGFGTYTFGASGVPGLVIDPATGVISGTPTQAGNKTLTVTLDDSFGDPEAVALLPITINPALAITTASLPNGNPGVAYSATLAKSGGTAPFTWSISAGTLPTGLALDSATGIISGTSNTVAVSNFTVTLTDSGGATKTKILSIKIGNPPTFTSIAPNAFARNRLNQAVTINGTFFQTGLTLSFGPGVTVNGTVTVNAAKTQITTHIDIAGNASLGANDATVTNPDGGTVTSPGALTINGVSITTNTCNVRKSTAMTGFTIVTANGNAPYTWTSSGQPGWITLNPATGALTGTAPATTGAVQFTVVVTDGTGSSDSATFTVVITNGNPGNPKC